jgi:formate hydrogenlyase subunit 3/multisubunit Na+/H+ antiporter MnhD subunit
MLDVALVLIAACSWIGASLLSVIPRLEERWSRWLGLLGAGLASIGAVHVLATGGSSLLEFPFWRGSARLELDVLSAAFLFPMQLVAGLGVAYGKEYWPLHRLKGGGHSLRFHYGTLVAALTCLLVARHGLLFLLAWEIMAVSAFLLIGTDHENPEVRRASWVYLVCTHTGTALLTAMVILLARRSGGLLWLPLPAGNAPGLDIWILLLALLGFGFKAGVLPLHFWLPSAHASAPSHVSALLSSVMLKMGIYGILRISGLLPSIPSGFGSALVLLGALSAVYGVGNALAQSDYKRLLAYSSIENIGIIVMGVGLGLAGRANHDPWLVALGFGGAIFHVWNHSIFKSLLFFGAGSILHATGTRDMESLGGLASRMPTTALLMFPAVLAVSALPPFNAFLSEWFLYRGVFAALSRGYPWSAALALAGLAFTGGLAAVAFAKFYGIIFLGSPRSPQVEHAHDPSWTMLLPMAILACLSLGTGLAAVLLLPCLDRIVAVIAPGSPALLAQGLRMDLRFLVGAETLLVVCGALAFLWWRRSVPSPGTASPRPPTWDCGYALPVPRAEYTGSSFSDAWAPLQPGLKVRIRRITAIFPKSAPFRSEFRDMVGEMYLGPWMERIAARLLRFRWLQPGYLSIYILYVLLALLAAFLWMLLRGRLLG